MKTGSKKKYRNHRAYVQRDVRKREEAAANLRAAQRIYNGNMVLNCNHLDPLLDAQHDQATENFVVLTRAQHEFLEAEDAMDKSIEAFEEVCANTGIDPKIDQFTP